VSSRIAFAIINGNEYARDEPARERVDVSSANLHCTIESILRFFSESMQIFFRCARYSSAFIS
jgi:hypothetical protein